MLTLKQILATTQ